eukprot:scaffold1785_cov247-Pinguiococcus_pyrenoidosus.AAC.8
MYNLHNALRVNKVQSYPEYVNNGFQFGLFHGCEMHAIDRRELVVAPVVHNLHLHRVKDAGLVGHLEDPGLQRWVPRVHAILDHGLEELGLFRTHQELRSGHRTPQTQLPRRAVIGVSDQLGCILHAQSQQQGHVQLPLGDLRLAHAERNEAGVARHRPAVAQPCERPCPGAQHRLGTLLWRHEHGQEAGQAGESARSIRRAGEGNARKQASRHSSGRLCQHRRQRQAALDVETGEGPLRASRNLRRAGSSDRSCPVGTVLQDRGCQLIGEHAQKVGTQRRSLPLRGKKAEDGEEILSHVVLEFVSLRLEPRSSLEPAEMRDDLPNHLERSLQSASRLVRVFRLFVLGEALAVPCALCVVDDVVDGVMQRAERHVQAINVVLQASRLPLEEKHPLDETGLWWLEIRRLHGSDDALHLVVCGQQLLLKLGTALGILLELVAKVRNLLKRLRDLSRLLAKKVRSQ